MDLRLSHDVGQLLQESGCILSTSCWTTGKVRGNCKQIVENYFVNCGYIVCVNCLCIAIVKSFIEMYRLHVDNRELTLCICDDIESSLL